MNITNIKKEANYYQIVQKNDSSVYSINYFRLNDSLLMKGIALDEAGTRLQGWSYWFHENGLVESEGFYENGVKTGALAQRHRPSDLVV